MTKTNYTGTDIGYILALAQDVVSLNTPVHYDDTEETEIGDFVEDTSPTPEEEAIKSDRLRRIEGYLTKFLTPRERDIIRCRFGFDDGHPMRLIEIGKRYGICRERIRQIEAKALRKLRFAFAKHHITWENI